MASGDETRNGKSNKKKKLTSKKSISASAAQRKNISKNKNKADSTEYLPSVNDDFNYPVAYDEGLLERTRLQWQLGDWKSLVQLDKDTLRHHPDRAKLALFAAAGHLQIKNSDEARYFIRQAQDWGCNQKQIARILTAGVYNTLGRASLLINKNEKGLAHFDNSVAIGIPQLNNERARKARAERQLSDLQDEHSELDRLTESSGSKNNSLLNYQCAYFEERKRINELLESALGEIQDVRGYLKDQFVGLNKKIDFKLKSEVVNAAKQIEAFFCVHYYFDTGILPFVSTESNAWPVSPDFSLFLIGLLEKNKYDLIIEFGSGYSTVLVSAVVDKLKSKSVVSGVKQLAFEHHKNYFDKTNNQLHQAGFSKSVDLIFSPLVPYCANSGVSYRYYDCFDYLSNVSKTNNAKFKKILVIVDGPPGDTGRHARYPALPIVFDIFQGSDIDFLTDDYARTDEKEISVLWQNYLNDRGVCYSLTEISLEKGAALLSIEVNCT